MNPNGAKKAKLRTFYTKDASPSPKENTPEPSVDDKKIRYFVQIDDVSIPESELRNLGVTDPSLQIVCSLQRSYLDLQANAKGKADLYFHAYFWIEYIKHFHAL